MQIERTEGVILQTIPFGNYDQILTVMTLDQGICKFLLKGAYSAKYGNGSLTAALVKAEFCFSKGRSELFSCREIGLMSSHLHIRQSYQMLEAACDLAQALLASQLLAKPAPDLYHLLVHYLERLPQTVDHWAVSASYRLKVLRHEGLLNLMPECSKCQDMALAIAEGEGFCSNHKPHHAVLLTSMEMEMLMELTYCRHFSQLANMSLPPYLFSKIKTLFNAMLEK